MIAFRDFLIHASFPSWRLIILLDLVVELTGIIDVAFDETCPPS